METPQSTSQVQQRAAERQAGGFLDWLSLQGARASPEASAEAKGRQEGTSRGRRSTETRWVRGS